MRTAIVLLVTATTLTASTQPRAIDTVTVLQPSRVFDGSTLQEGWSVIVRNDRIEAAGAGLTTPPGAETIALPGLTLLPGLIEGHSHLLLHPYNETSWNDQVAREPLAYRVARAVNHARDTLMAGVTTCVIWEVKALATQTWD